MATLGDWAAAGWLVTHEPSRQELDGLLAIVARDRRDAAVAEISADARLGLLYNAGLKLADVALRASGYRAARDAHHYRVIAALPLTLGPAFTDDAEMLERVRVLRNKADYESVGFATAADISEMLGVIERLTSAVTRRMRDR